MSKNDDTVTIVLSQSPTDRAERSEAARRADARANEIVALDKLKAEGWSIETTSSGWVAGLRGF